MADTTTNILELRGVGSLGAWTGLRQSRTALFWAGLGFVIGAAFWHLIGFWSFVSYVVLNGDGSVPHTQAVVRKNDVQAASKRAAVEAARSCVKLVRSRSDANTAAVPCDPNDRILHQLGGLAARQDRALLHPSAGWAVTAETPSGETARN